jgi:hypothetical protein
MHLTRTRRRKLRIHWPLNNETFERFLTDPSGSAYASSALSDLTGVIERTPELGDFGSYTDVVEMSLGYESFLVGSDANATLGTPGERAVSPTLVVTTYLGTTVTDERVDEILESIVRAHPWEVPVIELMESVELVAPASVAVARVHA